MKNSFRYNFRLFLNVYSLFKPLQGCEILLGEDGVEFCTCFDMIAFMRKEVGMWKKDYLNLVSWTLARLCVLFLKLEYKPCGAFDNCNAIMDNGAF